ncbi:MAG: MFS transporter [Caldilineales bacterium]|nr:MFS transporter [Caldilineales bacterium]
MLPSYVRDPRYLANSCGHFIIDVLNSTIPIVLALMSASLGVSNAGIGLIVTLHTFGNSLTQPAFGWLADRFGDRWMGAVGLLWIGLFYGLAALSPGWLAVVFIIISGLGSAAYHPQGAVKAGRVPFQYIAAATSVFFLFGQVGLGIGPALAGSMAAFWGRQSLIVLAVVAVAVGLWQWRLGLPRHNHADHAHHQQTSRARVSVGVMAMVLFALLLFTRMTVQSTTNTFLPKYLQDLGWSPAIYGLFTSMLFLGSAFGNLAGGWFADHWGRRKVVSGSMFLAAIPLWFYLGTSGLVFALLILSIGFLTGAGFSVTVVMAQAMLPNRQALASGLTLGFIFASGAVGAAIAGWVSDQVGLAVVLQGMALLAVISGLFGLGLPSTRTSAQPQAVPSPSTPS